MKTKAVFFQFHKKREDFFLLILNSHINKRIEGGFRDRSKATQCSYPSQISLADQSGKCRTKPQRQVFLIFIFPFRVVDLNKSQKSDRQTARFLSGGKKFLFL